MLLSKRQKQLIVFLRKPRTVKSVCKKFGFQDAFAFFDFIEHESISSFLVLDSSGLFSDRMLQLNETGMGVLESLLSERRSIFFKWFLASLVFPVTQLILAVLELLSK